jgi:hypothetical protein
LVPNGGINNLLLHISREHHLRITEYIQVILAGFQNSDANLIKSNCH